MREPVHYQRRKMADDDLLCVLIALIADDDTFFPDITPELEEPPRKKRKFWVRPWIRDRGNDEQNTMYKLQKELELHDKEEYRMMLRMSTDAFYLLLELVGPSISKQSTSMRAPIPPEERLSITLHYLATGESQKSISRQFRIGKNTVGIIVPETCVAIYECLRQDYLTTPRAPSQWREVADGFEKRWNFPHCLGGLDGKHVRIHPPANTGSLYYNYKGFFSIVLMALVDSQYEFTYVDVGAEGRVADGGVWKGCSLKLAIDDGEVVLPEPAYHPETEIAAPYCIVADDAFPLSINIMKPFSRRGLEDSERIFNYRLSRARRVSKNAFGILSNRFRSLLGTLYMLPTSATQAVLATTALHNFLRRQSKQYLGGGAVDQEDASFSTVPGEWRQDTSLVPIPHTFVRNSPTAAKHARRVFADYYMSPEGAVQWQWKVLSL